VDDPRVPIDPKAKDDFRETFASNAIANHSKQTIASKPSSL
jgi:hypothetical protein